MTNVWYTVFSLSALLSLALPHRWDIILPICFLSLISFVPSDPILLVINFPTASSCPHPLAYFPYSVSGTFLTSLPSSRSYAAGGLLLAPVLVDFHRWDTDSKHKKHICWGSVKYTPPKYTSVSLKYTSDRSLEIAGWPGQLITAGPLI